MNSAIVISLLTAAAALVTSAVTATLGFQSSKRLVDVNAKVEDRRSEQAALRDYLYEARKRMYSELLPSLFVLGEQCDDAYWRVRGIARAASDGRLDPGNKRFPPNISSKQVEHQDYFISTIYRLVAPCALVTLCQERLTSIDLSADQHVAQIYNLGRLLRRTWNSADDFGRHDAPIREVIPRLPGQQINLRELDLFVETLIARVPHQAPHVRCYADVIDLYTDPESVLAKRIKPFEMIFSGFHPASKPLLWRALLAQAEICDGIRTASQDRRAADGTASSTVATPATMLDRSRTARRDQERPDRLTPRAVLAKLDKQLFSWAPADADESHHTEVQAALNAAHHFVCSRIASSATEDP